MLSSWGSSQVRVTESWVAVASRPVGLSGAETGSSLCFFCPDESSLRSDESSRIRTMTNSFRDQSRPAEDHLNSRPAAGVTSLNLNVSPPTCRTSLFRSAAVGRVLGWKLKLRTPGVEDACESAVI